MVTDDPVADHPGANSQVVAELTLSLTLVLRRMPELDRRLRAGETMLSINNFGRTLRSKVVGMVGMSTTARRAAEIFHGSHFTYNQMPMLRGAFSTHLAAPSTPSHPPRLQRGGLPPIPLAFSLTPVIPPCHLCFSLLTP